MNGRSPTVVQRGADWSVALARVGAAGTLLAVLVAVPVVVWSTVGVPWTAARWRDAVALRQSDESVIVGLGLIVFSVLWVWALTTAVVEAWVSLRWRRDPGRALPDIGGGPSGLLRRAVRAVVIAGVIGPATVGGIARVDLGQPLRAVVSASSSTVSTAVSPVAQRDHRAERSTVGAARDHDADGFLAPRAPSAPSATDHHGSQLSSAVMLAAGALAALEAARRRRLRAAAAGARLTLPSLSEMRTELMLRRLDATDVMVRLDVAIRAAAPVVAAGGAAVLGAVVSARGDVWLHLTVPLDPRHVIADVDGRVVDAATQGWTGDGMTATWYLPAAVSLERLASLAVIDRSPCPALAHLGRTDAGDCFVDLEAMGLLTVRSTRSDDILRGLSASLAVSPHLPRGRLVCIDLDDPLDENAAVDTVDAALDVAAGLLGDTADVLGRASTFHRRVTTAGGELWEPVIVVARRVSVDDLAMLRAAAPPRRGIAAVVGLDRAEEPAGIVPGWVLEQDLVEPDRHVLAPIGLIVHCEGVASDDIASVAALLDSEQASFEVAAPVVPISLTVRSDPFREPEWSFLVRLLGPVEVVTAAGEPVLFERSKALELVVWLCTHRRRPTRSAARGALWDLDVQDATFANVVSEARRSLARAVPPPDGAEWIGRTLTDALPIHEQVITDAALLELRVRAAQGRPHRDAIEVLSAGVELLVGMPFAGTTYMWSDAEGHASSLVLTAVGAAAELAAHHLAVGDIDGVFWATGQGLRVLNGHEGLIALRMRAHAAAGDLAGVRGEWERYERSLVADPWSAAEPSPKLAELRRDLLGRAG